MHTNTLKDTPETPGSRDALSYLTVKASILRGSVLHAVCSESRRPSLIPRRRNVRRGHTKEQLRLRCTPLAALPLLTRLEPCSPGLCCPTVEKETCSLCLTGVCPPIGMEFRAPTSLAAWNGIWARVYERMCSVIHALCVSVLYGVCSSELPPLYIPAKTCVSCMMGNVVFQLGMSIFNNFHNRSSFKLTIN